MIQCHFEDTARLQDPIGFADAPDGVVGVVQNSQRVDDVHAFRRERQIAGIAEMQVDREIFGGKIALANFMVIGREVDAMNVGTGHRRVEQVASLSMSDFEDFLALHGWKIENHRNPGIVALISPLSHPIERLQRSGSQVFARGESSAGAIVPGRLGL